jgi:hypothetical protein
MKKPIFLAAAVAVLLSGVTAASAVTMSKSINASDSRTLTGPQQKTAWHDLYMGSLNQKVPSRFNAVVGAVVPSSITTAPVTSKAARDIPSHHRIGNAVEIAAWYSDLGTDSHVRRFQLLQDAAKILFRFTVAVLHRGVEIVHTGSAWSRGSPRTISPPTAPQPKPSTESRIPVRPNTRISIVGSFPR